MSDRAANSHDARIGQRIKQVRESKVPEMTTAMLGAVIGVSYQQMRKFEGGLSALKARQLDAIAKHLDQPVEFFLDKI